MNCADGSVEVIAEGTREQLDKLVSWCAIGPPGAQVQKIRTEWAESKNEFQGFLIKR
jgi:acylphosphatase